MGQHGGGEEKAQFSSTLTRQHGGIHWPSTLKKGDRRAKATLRAEVSQGRGVRQAWSPFLSSDWVGVVKVCEPCAFSSHQLWSFIDTSHTIKYQKSTTWVPNK
ncbi:hypothetical protein PMI05_03711 [Brevibacillus sp. BC25]|nr:hypothetical protein PMI05_03711 [Brevibacillus sp. BC25]